LKVVLTSRGARASS
jgi:hypothetical protein